MSYLDAEIAEGIKNCVDSLETLDGLLVAGNKVHNLYVPAIILCTEDREPLALVHITDDNPQAELLDADQQEKIRTALGEISKVLGWR